MANLAAILKDEIRRLARKEAKSITSSLQRSSAQHRRDIAALKRQVAALERKVALLEKRAWSQSPASAATGAADLENIRFSAKGLASHRARLGLSAAEYAALLDVSPQTVYNWEHGRARPRAEQMAGIVNLRGISKKEALARLEQIA
jgi:DNA-binding transcriptional regulator YiaG